MMKYGKYGQKPKDPEKSMKYKKVPSFLGKGKAKMDKEGNVSKMPKMKMKGFDRKNNGKGSDYKPGTRVPAVEESLRRKDEELA